jgi:hypothetical protein
MLAPEHCVAAEAPAVPTLAKATEDTAARMHTGIDRRALRNLITKTS